MSKLSIVSGLISYFVFLIYFTIGEKHDLASNKLITLIVIGSALVMAAIFTGGLTAYIEELIYGETPRYIEKPLIWRYLWSPVLPALILLTFLLIVIVSYIGLEKFI